MSKPRVILAVDRPGWAFHNIGRQLERHLGECFDFRIVPAELLRSAQCDLAVVLWWRTHPAVVKNTNAKSIMLCLYDHVSWCKHPLDICDFETALHESDILAVSNVALLDKLRDGNQMARPTFLIEDGVDTEMFQPSPFPDEFTVGWCGDSMAGHGLIKGLPLIQNACKLAGAKLLVSDRSNGTAINFEDMPEWYSKISCYVCASTFEGTPNPPLEAMACGRPVVSTRVGVLPRVIQHGYSGFFAERQTEALALGISALRSGKLEQMGAAARRAVLPYDWKYKVAPWKSAIEAALDCGANKRPANKKYYDIQRRPRGLMISDVRGWAFDVNERDMAEYLTEFDFDFHYTGESESLPDMSKYDFAFAPYHRWGILDAMSSTPLLGSLRSADFDPQRPGVVPWNDKEWMWRCNGFHVVTREAYDRLKSFDNVVYLTNPVNTKRFPESTRVDGIVPCWAGNAQHASSAMKDVKGYHSIVIPACNELNMPINVAEYNTTRIAPQDMPAWYLKSNVYLCASAYEGASNSVMEAMASGLAVIATDVGNHREMMESQMKHFGATGIVLVERTKEAFKKALSGLTSEQISSMGALNRSEIISRWSWDVWRDRYADFVRMAL